MLIALANGTPISRICAVKMHSYCIEIGCKCACGCNIGKSLSNMSARRSTDCTHDRHNSCYKQSGADCPCYCHEMPVLDNHTNKFSRSGNCRNGRHDSCFYFDCSCSHHAPQTIIFNVAKQPIVATIATIPNIWNSVLIEPDWATLFVDNPNVPWVSQTFANYCYYPAKAGVKTMRGKGHDTCPKQGKVFTCKCPCHKYFDALRNTSNVSTTVQSMNYTPASVKLNSIAKEVKRQIFLDVDIAFDFVGETVRDALFGSLINKYVIDYTTNSVAKIFIEKSLEQFKIAGEDYYELNTLYGIIKVTFLKDTDEPYWWSCDWFRYNLNKGIIPNSSKCNLLENNKILALSGDISKCDNPQVVLEQGVKYAQQYGWTFEQNSIDKLTLAIKKNQPLENTHELVIGFRAYNLQLNSFKRDQFCLTGNFGIHWKTESLTVDCVDFKQHISEIDADWRGRPGADSNGADGKHDCGIYVYKDPSECLYHYGKTESLNSAIALVYGWGVIAEFEKGYRVEKCKISRLWIWDKDKKLIDDYKLDQIVSGAKFTDFLYDPEVMQFAGRSG